ncbi:MAG TPA: helix-turn-helix transcriptional regulator [Nocardioides sp.]|nr:helix-turn-helix transcriptional regulator [Nocardioides sp.]
MRPAAPARPHQDLGARIRKRRQVLGWKQQELADRIGVHVNSVQKWEKGE